MTVSGSVHFIKTYKKNNHWGCNASMPAHNSKTRGDINNPIIPSSAQRKNAYRCLMNEGRLSIGSSSILKWQLAESKDRRGSILDCRTDNGRKWLFVNFSTA